MLGWRWSLVSSFGPGGVCKSVFAGGGEKSGRGFTGLRVGHVKVGMDSETPDLSLDRLDKARI